jgi:adenine-specific DNA-methyltransferase
MVGTESINMDKLKLHSLDGSKDQVKRLMALFPNCLTEAKDEAGKTIAVIDFDLLRQEICSHVIDGPAERYGLSWPGKREALVTANLPVAKALRPCYSESVDFNGTKNLFIEGDNLDGLKLIQETFLNRVKIIFIDPPYNTGHDFLYEDDFAESSHAYLRRSNQRSDEGSRLTTNTESNGRFHSDWLSMMYPRLRLARNLLRDDGIIFITISDVEVANLRKLCDEVFGESNFVANIIWQKKYTRSNDAKWFSDNHDHVLCFAKDKTCLRLNSLPRTDEQISAYTNPDNHPKGPWKATPLHAKSGTNTNAYKFLNGSSWTPPTGTFRRFNDESMRAMEEGDEIWFGADGRQAPSRKSFLTEIKEGVVPVTIWPYDQVGHNHEANIELKELGLHGAFDNPKPSRLVERAVFLASSPEKNDIVLDFFAGSATTACAVMALNAKDGGSRRFILMQFPEPCDKASVAFKSGFSSIAEITKERIRRAGAKIKAENATTAPNLDIGFRVLKIDTSNMEDVYYAPDSVKQSDLVTHEDNIKKGRTAEDLLFQVLVDWGVDLSLPITQEVMAGRGVFFVDGNALAACFDASISEELVKEMARRKPLRAVFRDSSYGGDSVKINVEQIFKLLSPATELRSL